MTIQDKTEAYYMAKFEDYIRKCKHFAMMPTGLCPEYGRVQENGKSSSAESGRAR